MSEIDRDNRFVLPGPELVPPSKPPPDLVRCSLEDTCERVRSSRSLDGVRSRAAGSESRLPARPTASGPASSACTCGAAVRPGPSMLVEGGGFRKLLTRARDGRPPPVGAPRAPSAWPCGVGGVGGQDGGGLRKLLTRASDASPSPGVSDARVDAWSAGGDGVFSSLLPRRRRGSRFGGGRCAGSAAWPRSMPMPSTPTGGVRCQLTEDERAIAAAHGGPSDADRCSSGLLRSAAAPPWAGAAAPPGAAALSSSAAALALDCARCNLLDERFRYDRDRRVSLRFGGAIVAVLVGAAASCCCGMARALAQRVRRSQGPGCLRAARPYTAGGTSATPGSHVAGQTARAHGNRNPCLLCSHAHGMPRVQASAPLRCAALAQT